jgi:hypothetical protein
MDVCRIGSYCPPGSTLIQRQEADRSVLVTDPQLVDISAALQLGYINFEDNEIMIGGGIGIHYRPMFNLEVSYDFSIEGMDTLAGDGTGRPVSFMHNLGVTIITTLSEAAKTNIGFRAAFSAMQLLGDGIENFIGVTGGIELGNYSPRVYLDYTYLNDLNGTSFHQAMMGMRVFLEIPN